MRFIQSRPWTSLSIVLGAILIGLNAYYVFKEDSQVVRAYFIDEYQKASIGSHVEQLQKETIVAPADTYLLTTDANRLSAITAQRGQEVAATDLLAVYKTEEIEEERTKLLAEQEAYQKELDDLTAALTQIEREEQQSTSAINSEELNETLSVHVELGLIDQNSTSTATAILNGHIAETNRQIALIEAQIAQLESRQGVMSPVDGVIASIKEEAGTITFEIYTAQKAMLAYLSEAEWQKVREGQAVTFNVNHMEEPLSGIVLKKQMLPTSKDSIWANELAKSVDLPVPSNYEVILQQDDSLEDIPFSTVGSASITVNEANDSYKVNKTWVKVAKNNEHQITVIGYDGKIRTEEIDVQFNTDTLTIFTGYLDEGTPILSNKKRTPMANCFRTLPLRKVEWTQFKTLPVKDYLKYLLF